MYPKRLANHLMNNEGYLFIFYVFSNLFDIQYLIDNNIRLIFISATCSIELKNIKVQNKQSARKGRVARRFRYAITHD